MNIFEEVESSVRTYSRSFPATFDRAHGYRMFDTSGRGWIDFLSGAGALNYGHNPPELVEAIIAYLRAGSVISSLDLQTAAKAAFLETFVEHILRPHRLDYVVQFCGPTGANAVEAALKLARLVTGRSNIIAFSNAYHGLSLGALAATGNVEKRLAGGSFLGNVSRFPYDGYSPNCDSLSLLEYMLDDPSSGIDPPAAIIVETVQGEGGVNVARDEWLISLRDITRRYGALLIVDDIQAGCGRTGTFFSFERSKIKPDIVCLSKSISGLGLPMSLVLIGREFDQWMPGQHNGTFRGNNLAFVSGQKAIERYWAASEFSSLVLQRSEVLKEQLALIEDKYSHRGAQSRGRGFFRGIRFAAPGFAARISRNCYENGLICETCGPRNEVLKLLPPLTIDVAGISEAFTILESALQISDRDHPDSVESM